MNKADIIICFSVFALAVAGVILWAVDAHNNAERTNYESTAVVETAASETNEERG